MSQVPLELPRRRRPSSREPASLRNIWYDVGFRAIAYQIILIGLIIAAAIYFVGNAQSALASRGISTGFDFLLEPAGFDIGETPIAFTSTDSFLRAYVVAVLNTIKVSVVGVMCATIIGLIVGVARLSTNILIRLLASAYVELFRNTPQLVQLIFWYAVITQLPDVGQALSIMDVVFVSNRGLVFPWPSNSGLFACVVAAFLMACIAAFFCLRWVDIRRRKTGTPIQGLWIYLTALIIGLPLLMWFFLGSPAEISVPKLGRFNFQGGATMSPEFLAIFLGLSLYIGAFIAEIVRSGIQSVGRGQIEAARAVGLSGSDIYRKIILPQAVRVMVPPAAAQYVSLVKNSSLGVAIGYPELFNINNTIITLSGHTIEAIGIMMAIYLSISFSIAVLMNFYNRHVQIRER
jgi:general L-amino acid transport system permease protein